MVFYEQSGKKKRISRSASWRVALPWYEFLHWELVHWPRKLSGKYSLASVSLMSQIITEITKKQTKKHESEKSRCN